MNRTGSRKRRLGVRGLCVGLFVLLFGWSLRGAGEENVTEPDFASTDTKSAGGRNGASLRVSDVPDPPLSLDDPHILPVALDEDGSRDVFACCLPTDPDCPSVCIETDQVGCWEQNGWFLDGTPDCLPGNVPCDLGACCTDLGKCEDLSGLGISCEDCQSLGGYYIGGAGCADDPCPVCPFFDGEHCIWDDTGDYFAYIDRSYGVPYERWADDFVADSTGTVQRICWIPCFYDPYNSQECHEDPPLDIDNGWMVRFYADADGLPGAEIGLPGGELLSPDLKDWIGGTSRCWEYSAPVLSGPALTTGECYWIEITGLGDQHGCQVYWQMNGDGNRYSVHDVDLAYGPEDVTWSEGSDPVSEMVDLSYCIDVGIQADCGAIPGACCTWDGGGIQCENLNHDECRAGDGAFFFPGQVCHRIACPGPPGSWLKMDPPPDVDKAAHGDANTQTCWQATAANMLAAAGYGTGATVQARADGVYEQLVAHFGTGSGWTDTALSWWLRSVHNVWPGNPYTVVSVYGYKTPRFPWDNPNGARFIGNELRRCQLVGMSISWPTWGGTVGTGGHTITAWGDTGGDAELVFNPLQVKVSDSDKDTGGDVQTYTYDPYFFPNSGGPNEGNGWYLDYTRSPWHPYVKHIVTLCPTGDSSDDKRTEKVVGSYRVCQKSLFPAATDLHYKVYANVEILSYRTTIDWPTENSPTIVEEGTPRQALDVDWDLSDNPVPNGVNVTITTEFVLLSAWNGIGYKDVSFARSLRGRTSEPGFGWEVVASDVEDPDEPDITGGYVIGAFEIRNSDAAAGREELLVDYRFQHQYRFDQDPEIHDFSLASAETETETYSVGNFRFGHSYGMLDDDALWEFEDWMTVGSGFELLGPDTLIEKRLDWESQLPYPPGENYIAADFDHDSDVDTDDYTVFVSCFTGAGGGPISAECVAADFDSDDDVDCDDWSDFVACWTEPAPPPVYPPCPIAARRPMPEDCSTIAPGTRCSDAPGCSFDDDCAGESRCVPPPTGDPPGGVCYAPKTRYLSIAPNPAQVYPTARRVTLGDGTPIGWVGAPYEQNGLWLAGIVDAPNYETPWPVVVHVMACEIAHASLCDTSRDHCLPDMCPPSQTCEHYCYRIQAINQGDDIGNEDNYSEVLDLCTNTTWGDTVSTCAGDTCKPPNGMVGLDDIMAAIKYFQGVTEVAPLTWLDIAPAHWDLAPDQNVGLDDILGCINGFQGKGYLGDGPLGCP